MSFILEAIRSPAAVKKEKRLQEKQPASVLLNQEKKCEAQSSFSFAGNLSDSIRPMDPDGRISNSHEKQIVEALYVTSSPAAQLPLFYFVFFSCERRRRRSPSISLGLCGRKKESSIVSIVDIDCVLAAVHQIGNGK